MMTKLEAIAYYKANVLPGMPEKVRAEVFRDGEILDNPLRLSMNAGGVCFPLHWNEAMAFLPTAWNLSIDNDFVFILIGPIADYDQQRLMWALHQLGVIQFWCDKDADDRWNVFRERFIRPMMES